jgi:hypothetical protein
MYALLRLATIFTFPLFAIAAAAQAHTPAHTPNPPQSRSAGWRLVDKKDDFSGDVTHEAVLVSAADYDGRQGHATITATCGVAPSMALDLIYQSMTEKSLGFETEQSVLDQRTGDEWATPANLPLKRSSVRRRLPTHHAEHGQGVYPKKPEPCPI